MSPVPWWLPLGSVPEIEPQTLVDRLQRGPGVFVLDVRTEAEFGRGHIAGAVNVPITRLRASLDGLVVPDGATVVAVCRTAHRSIPAVRLLRGRGFGDAVQLAGGMRAWWAASLPTATP